MSEEQDGIIEAEIILKANNLGKFEENPANWQAIDARKKELLDKALTFTWESMDIVTQAVISQIVYRLLKNPDKIDINDLKIVLSIGIIIAKEAKQ